MLLPILGVLVVASGIGALATLPRGDYRAGPWPGLTWRGASVLLMCAWLLLGLEMAAPPGQRAGRAWPDLVVWATLYVLPPLLATCVVRAPGCGSAVCGVFLLWRSLLSLVDTGVEPPPLLLPAAVGLDLAAWLRRSDLRPRRRSRQARRLTPGRVALAGGVFGLIFGLVEPSFARLLGSDPSGWTLPEVGLASASAAALGTAVGACLNRITKADAGGS